MKCENCGSENVDIGHRAVQGEVVKFCHCNECGNDEILECHAVMIDEAMQ